MLVLIGIIVAIAGVVLIVQGVQGKQGGLQSLGGLAVVIGVVVALLSSAFVVVPAGNVGVIFNVFGGVQKTELGEGFHLILPFIQQVTVLNAREQAISFADNDSIPALSKEGLQIVADATIRYKINLVEASTIYQELGTDYSGTLIRPTVRSVIRSAIANYNAADLISTSRAQLQTNISDDLTEQLKGKNIVLIDALLRDIRIPTSISQAIEEKQTAEQQVQVEVNRRDQAKIAAERAVIEAQGQRDAAIAKAEGEARALTLRGQAIRENPEIIQLEVAQRLSPSIRTILLPADNSFLLDLRSLGGGTTP